jgi:hypothetical protein
MRPAAAVIKREPSVTHDCLRLFNILSDWQMLEQPQLLASELFSLVTIQRVLRGDTAHSVRLSFALSLFLGVAEADLSLALWKLPEQLRIEGLLRRCKDKIQVNNNF